MKLAKHTLAIALLAGSALSAMPAIAQTQAPGSAQDGTQRIIPRQGQTAPGEAQPSQGSQDMGAAAPESGSTNAQNQDDNQPMKQQGDSTAEKTPADQSGQTDRSTAASEGSKPATGDPDSATTNDTARQNDGAAQEDSDQAATDAPSNETTGSVNISAEQKTEIQSVFVEHKVEPVDIDVDVSVGVAIPTTVELHPLPPRIVEIVPAYRGYEYFVLADGRIVIVRPTTHEVVYILTS